MSNMEMLVDSFIDKVEAKDIRECAENGIYITENFIEFLLKNNDRALFTHEFFLTLTEVYSTERSNSIISLNGDTKWKEVQTPPDCVANAYNVIKRMKGRS